MFVKGEGGTPQIQKCCPLRAGGYPPYGQNPQSSIWRPPNREALKKYGIIREFSHHGGGVFPIPKTIVFLNIALKKTLNNLEITHKFVSCFEVDTNFLTACKMPFLPPKTPFTGFYGTKDFSKI